MKNVEKLEVLTPGIIIFSMSIIMSSHFSGVSGASSGNNGLMYPGSTTGKTRLERSTFAFYIELEVMMNFIIIGRFQFEALLPFANIFEVI